MNFIDLLAALLLTAAYLKGTLTLLGVLVIAALIILFSYWLEVL